MINQQLGVGVVAIQADLSQFTAGLAKIQSSLAGLGTPRGGGGGGMAAAAKRAVDSQEKELDRLDKIQDRYFKKDYDRRVAHEARLQKVREAATAKEAAAAAKAAARGPSGMVGLGSLQMSGIKLQDRLEKERAQAEARGPAGLVGLGSLQMSGLKLQDRLAKEKATAAARAQSEAERLDAVQDRLLKRDYSRRVAYEARLEREKNAAAEKARAAAEKDAAFRAGRGQRAGMGLAQGLGLGGFATDPAQLGGQMIGQGLRAGWEMVGGAIKESAATAIDLQSTFLDMQRVTGGTAENTQTLKQAVFDIANKQAGVSVADVTGIMMGAAKAGVGDKEGPEGLVRFTKGIARVKNALGEGEGLTADSLTEQMTKVMNLFHLGTESAQGLGSALVKLANISTGSGGSIMDVTMGLSGTLASLGSDAATAFSFGSVVSDVGLTDKQGSNSLSQILRVMASDTKGLAETTGIPIQQLQNMIRTDLVGALEMVVGKFREINEIDPIKGQEFIKSLGYEGTRTGGAFQQLSSMIEQVRERASIARGEMQSLEALTSADTLKSDQTKSGIQRLENSFIELKDSIGTHFLPGIDLATEALSNLARSAAGNMPAILAGAGEAAKVGAKAVGGAGATAAGGVIPGLLGWLFGGTGATSAGAIPGKATGAFVGPPKPVDADAEAVKAGWKLAANGMMEAVAEEGKKGDGALVGPPIPNKVRNAMDRAAMNPKKAKPGADWWDATDIEAPKAKKQFQSQMFGDAADFGRHAIQAALSDKDPSQEMVKKQESTNKLLEAINGKIGEAIIPKATDASRGPLVLRGMA